jgi:hypothetical protein
MVLVRLASRSVVATVDSARVVSQILEDLSKAGVKPTDVSLLAKAGVVESTAAARPGRGPLASLGKAASWLLDPRQFDRPGSGQLLGAGSVADVLANSPSTSVTGALVMQGIPQHEAATFAARLDEGKIILLCGVADRTMGERVRAILTRLGASAIGYYSGRPYGTAFHGTGPGLR